MNPRTRWLWRSAAWCLERGIDRRVASDLIGDLEEEFHHVAATQNAFRSAAWLIRETASAIRAERRTRPQEKRLMFDRLRQHIRTGVRSLMHAPSFTATAAATLAIGIGATTAVGSVFHQTLLQPLPFPNSARLAVIAETRGESEISVSYPNFLDWQARAKSFDKFAVFQSVGATASDGGLNPERLSVVTMSPGLFDILGVAPAHGRGFSAEEDAPGGPRVAVIGDGFWRRRFGADPAVLGRTMRFDADTYTIVGIMPPGFDFPSGIIYNAAEVYTPMAPIIAASSDFNTRDAHPGLYALGLIKPRVPLAQARTELQQIAASLAREYPSSNRLIGVVVRDAVSAVVGDLRDRLVLIAGAAVLVLVIACANVAGLVLTRFAAREREHAVRAALGASRGMIAAGLFAEIAVLAAAGGALGIALAFGLLRAMTFAAADLPRPVSLSLSAPLLLWSLAATIITALVCGVAPAWRAGRSASALRQRGDSSGGRGRGVLVSTQVALATTLVVGAALLTSTLWHMLADRGGINPDDVVAADVRFPSRSVEQAQQFFERVAARAAQLPAITHVSATSRLPFTGGGEQSGIGRVGAARDEEVRTDVHAVMPDYFPAMGVALIGGRDFNDRDTSASTPVAIVDELLARRLWPGENPIGKHVEGWGALDREVIGLAAHVKNYGVSATSREELYVPYAQRPRARMFLIVRSAKGADALSPLIRGAVTAVDATVAVASVRAMPNVVERTVAGPRLAAALSLWFAAAALGLALIGIAGLVSYLVELRRGEVGIRLALGAEPASVVRHFIGGALKLAGAGAAIGLAAAVGAGIFLRSQLFGIGSLDPLILTIVPLALLAASALASWIPARLAAKVSPSDVLRR